MSTVAGYLKYRGGYDFEYRGGHLEYHRGYSVSWVIMMHVWDIMSPVGVFSTVAISSFSIWVPGGISLYMWRDIMSTVLGVPYRGGTKITKDFPSWYWTPPQYSWYLTNASWYPPGTEYPPRYSRYSPWYSWYPPTVLMVRPAVLSTPPRYWTHIIQGENLHHRFVSFSPNQIFRNVYLSVTNCNLVENILDTFRIAQAWCDYWILRCSLS